MAVPKSEIKVLVNGVEEVIFTCDDAADYCQSLGYRVGTSNLARRRSLDLRPYSVYILTRVFYTKKEIDSWIATVDGMKFKVPVAMAKGALRTAGLLHEPVAEPVAA